MKIPVNWTFKSREVADGFDSHVREQLPWYDAATGLVCHFAKAYVPDGGVVYDIGASTGNITEAMYSSLEGRSATVLSVDSSDDMASVYRGGNTLIVSDACAVDYEPFDFAVCFLVLMFIPPGERAALLRTLKNKVKLGGCIFVLDKMVPVGGYLGSVNTKISMAAKLANGVDASSILQKELSLLGVQRPLESGEMSGFIEVFRYGDFAGWVYERGLMTANR